MADELETAVEAEDSSTETVVEETKEAVSDATNNDGVEESVEAIMEENAAEGSVQDATKVSETEHDEVIETDEEAAPPSRFIGDMIFSPATKNPAMGLAMTLGGMLAFTMGMHTFFQIAMAWTFVIWGLLLIFVSVLNIYQKFEANDQGLSIRNPLRFWSLNKFWDWSTISRIDVMSSRRDTRPEELDMHIYREVAGEMVKEREDVKFDSDMAQVIIERASLKPVDDQTPSDLDRVPLSTKATYHWTKSGSLA